MLTQHFPWRRIETCMLSPPDQTSTLGKWCTSVVSRSRSNCLRVLVPGYYPRTLQTSPTVEGLLIVLQCKCQVQGFTWEVSCVMAP